MDMENDNVKSQLLEVVQLSAHYCSTVENCLEMRCEEFVREMTTVLPRLYLLFNTLTQDDVVVSDYGYYSEYVDEQWYETVRRNMERVLGSEDTYLETFEEDMKYSDTPIAASVSEGLADIFQPLYNFISIVKESDGEELEGAYLECRDNFESYWSQTLCNVMRPLNKIKNSD